VKGNPDSKAIAAAAIVSVAAWLYTLSSARSMAMAMPMPGGGSMSMAWMRMGHQSTVAHAAMFLTMWTVMMVAMMLPSVMPAVLLHRRLLESRLSRGEAARGSQLLLVFGYFGVWAAFGLAAYAVGMVVSSAAMRSVDVSLFVPAGVGLALTAAGLYQLTPLKRVCLQHCRAPLDFFGHHEIGRARDSWRFGVHHGAYCAGCCWGLMTIQLVLGIMSVPLMALIAGVILAEKRWRHGERLARVVGAVALAAGLLIALRATIPL
jgi:predicted metal-binding membrane protein